MKRVAALAAVAAVCIGGGGWLLSVAWHLSYGHGVYCAIGMASTVGCDANPSGPAGRLAVVAVMLTATPMLAAVFAWVTGRIASERAREHVAAAERRLTAEADQRHVIMQTHVERLLKGHCDDIKGHVSAVADAQVSGGSRTQNPASQGLNADQPPRADPPLGGERVVPPPATRRKTATPRERM